MPKYTYTKIFLRLLSMCLPLTNEIKSHTCMKSRLFMATLFLLLWCQSALLRGLFVKPGLGHWQKVQTQIRCCRMCLIRLCTVCLNYRKFRFKWNSLKSPFRIIFPAYTQRQSTHQCCQCFDLESRQLLWLYVYLMSESELITVTSQMTLIHKWHVKWHYCDLYTNVENVQVTRPVLSLLYVMENIW